MADRARRAPARVNPAALTLWGLSLLPLLGLLGLAVGSRLAPVGADEGGHAPRAAAVEDGGPSGGAGRRPGTR